jgi:hypothetical protein
LTKQDAREAIFGRLAPHLPGFKRRKKNDEFARKIPAGTQLIGVSLVDYRPQFAFALPVCTRIEEVEEMFNRFAGGAPAYHKMTLTTMTRLEYFYSEREQKQFKFESEAELDVAVTELVPVLRDRVLPFLDAHQDIKSLDAVVSSPDGDAFDRSNPPYRQMHALILSRLAGNPGFDALATRYADDSRAWHPVDQKKLTNLVMYLRTI